MPVTTVPDLLLGGRYRLERTIGIGGMSTVYLARDEHLGRAVAVKLYDASAIDAARQESELAVLSDLNHHCLVSLYDAGSSGEPGRPTNRYLVMAHINGMNLRDRLLGPRIAARNIAEIGYDMAEALEYIHSRGVIHRDIKPSNILLVDYGIATRRARAQLTDFGIALSNDSERLTLDGHTTGTAAYLSPEQASGRPVETPSDMYSLGLVLLECFTREVEYPGTVLESALARLSRHPRIPDYLPPHWKSLFASMLANDPRDRPTGRELVSSMRQIVIAESARHKESDLDDFPGAPANGVYAPHDSVFDTIPNEVLHRATAMAARLFAAPVAAVSIADGNRTKLVSHFGQEVDEIVRKVDLSGPSEPHPETIYIADARKHPRAKDSELVKGPLAMRFYAGAPLRRRDGTVIGTLSVMNTVPYKPSAKEMASLEDLAALIVAQLDSHDGGETTAESSLGTV